MRKYLDNYKGVLLLYGFVAISTILLMYRYSTLG